MTAEHGFVGTCTSCGSRMIEYAAATGPEERTIQFECQSDECSQTGLVRHAVDERSVDDPAKQCGVEDVEVVELNWIDCPRCNGHGWVEGGICDLERAMGGRDTPCPNCSTSGRVPRIVETDAGTQAAETYRDPEASENLPENCRVCNHKMREVLTPGKTQASCSNCDWRWSA